MSKIPFSKQLGDEVIFGPLDRAIDRAIARVAAERRGSRQRVSLSDIQSGVPNIPELRFWRVQDIR